MPRRRLQSASCLVQSWHVTNIDPKIEEMVGKTLGLQPVRLATQVIQRDRHAEFVTTMAIVSSTLEKIATEVRNLQRTDIREVEEYFSPGRSGSSLRRISAIRSTASVSRVWPV